jgi:hypothetical protein
MGDHLGSSYRQIQDDHIAAEEIRKVSPVPETTGWWSDPLPSLSPGLCPGRPQLETCGVVKDFKS